MSDQKQIDKGRAAAVRAGMGPWFRRASTHGPLIAGLLVLSGGAPAVATDAVFYEMKVGVMSHDASVLGSNEDTGIYENADILFQVPEFLSAIRSEVRRLGKAFVSTSSYLLWP